MKTVLQRSSMILSSLPPQMTTQLFACAFERAAKAGEALFVAGDRGDGCYRVEQGLVKITVTSDRGEERRVLSDLKKRGVIEQRLQTAKR